MRDLSPSPSSQMREPGPWVRILPSLPTYCDTSCCLEEALVSFMLSSERFGWSTSILVPNRFQVIVISLRLETAASHLWVKRQHLNLTETNRCTVRQKTKHRAEVQKFLITTKWSGTWGFRKSSHEAMTCTSQEVLFLWNLVSDWTNILKMRNTQEKNHFGNNNMQC